LLAQQGEVAAAEEICLRLLAYDDMNAGAHYLLALCRETLGDRQGARDHDRLAIHLDPGFAMPRLHLGLLARRTGDRRLARTELGQALTLLKREDVTRLLFFGGGFGREGLIDLCESALKDCGRPP
jgi:chemotaxis protein methyltransferase CheR